MRDVRVRLEERAFPVFSGASRCRAPAEGPAGRPPPAAPHTQSRPPAAHRGAGPRQSNRAQCWMRTAASARGPDSAGAAARATPRRLGAQAARRPARPLDDAQQLAAGDRRDEPVADAQARHQVGVEFPRRRHHDDPHVGRQRSKARGQVRPGLVRDRQIDNRRIRRRRTGRADGLPRVERDGARVSVGPQPSGNCPGRFTAPFHYQYLHWMVAPSLPIDSEGSGLQPRRAQAGARGCRFREQNGPCAYFS